MARPVSSSSARPPTRGGAGDTRPVGRSVSGGPADRSRPRSSARGVAEPQIQGRDLGRKGPISPFSHLARTHLWSVAGDAFITSALATTVFFNNDPNAPRERVALYLLLTLAPFAVASPFIGPLIDRLAGGRKWMIFGASITRAVVALLLVGDLENARFYLWAFLLLVLSKIHLISKSALLPTTVRNDAELVEANSKLSLLGALAGAVAGGPGFAIAKLLGPQWTIGIATVAFIVATVQAHGLPQAKVAEQPVGDAERDELQGAGIIRAAEAMSALRFVVGFLTFGILFDFRSAGVDNYWYAIAAASAQAGFLAGSALAPSLRKVWVEERLVMLAIGLSCVVAAIASFLEGLWPAVLLAMVMGAVASVAKQAFDSLVQRDAPDANRGRSFARFESRFQLVWVLGAFIPVAFPIDQRVMSVVVALVTLFAVTQYFIGYRQIRMAAAGLRPPIPPHRPLHRRIYELVRPSARTKPEPAFDPSITLEHPPPGPLVTGFLTDELDPLDPTTVADASPLGPGGAPLPPLAPSNPLVGGRWRSPQPEELFSTEDVPLPVPPPDVTPTGLFAPSVPSPPVPPDLAAPPPPTEPQVVEQRLPFDDLPDPLGSLPAPDGWETDEPQWRNTPD